MSSPQLSPRDPIRSRIADWFGIASFPLTLITLIPLVVSFLPVADRLLSDTARPYVTGVLAFVSGALLMRFLLRKRHLRELDQERQRLTDELRQEEQRHLTEMNQARQLHFDELDQEQQRHQAATDALRARYEDQERTKRLRADIALIRARLDGWSVESEFHEYMYHHAAWNNLRGKWVDQMREREERWAVDTRRIYDQTLRERFEALAKANANLAEYIAQYTWSDDRWNRDEQTFAEYTEVRMLSTSNEWNAADKREAYQTLNRGRTEFLVSLQALFAALHDAESVSA